MSANPADINRQRGAYPLYVAEWLHDKLETLEFSYDVNNNKLIPSPIPVPFEDLPGFGLFNKNKIDYMKLPDFGYNVEVEPDFEADTVKFVPQPRKADSRYYFGISR